MKNQIQIKGSPTRGLIGATLGFFFGSAAISLFGPSSVKFNEVMTLSPSLMGLLVAIPSLSGSLLRVPFGAWVDTTGGKKPFTILMILATLGMAGLSFILSSNYPDSMDGKFWYMLLFGCLSGCGIAVFSVGSGQTSYWFTKKEQGKALGIFGGIGTSAAGIFALCLPIILSKAGLVNAYFIWTIFLLVGTILYMIIGCDASYFQFRRKGLNNAESKEVAQEYGQELFPSGSVKESLVESAKIPTTWILVFSYFCTFGGFMALTAWFPTYWIKFFGLDSIHAGILTAIFSILAALIRIPSGSLSDKFGGQRVSSISMVILLVAGVILGLSTNIALSVAGALLFSLSFGLNNAAVMKLVPMALPSHVGGATGWVGGLGAFGGFVIPPFLGKIVAMYGNIGFARGFFIFCIFSILNLIILYCVLNKKHDNK